MTIDLMNNEGLKKAIEEIIELDPRDEWRSLLKSQIQYVAEASYEDRCSREFQEVIWENNHISNIGMGTVDISAAKDDEEFREWFARKSLEALPESYEEREAFLLSFFLELQKRIKEFAGRIARVKIFRVLAILYPRYFTTITAAAKALESHRAIFGKRKKPNMVARQLELMARLDDILGPCEASYEALADRMTIPWRLYSRYIQSSSSEHEIEQQNESGNIVLKPLPALQRRKGFTGLKGGVATIYSCVSFVQDGVSREELLDHLHAEFPDHRKSSLRTIVNILKNEFYSMQEEDGLIRPTARGELFLENEDLNELVPFLLTRILGVDNVLVYLSDSSRNVKELLKLLKTVNPGWTTDFAPRAMLKWLRDFNLVKVDNNGVHSLTDDGRYWLEQIHWEPELLPQNEPVFVDALYESEVALVDISSISLEKIYTEIKKAGTFPDELIKQLHYGLWSHQRRHFAIMAGLSGSGKTLLAKNYALALASEFVDLAESNVFIQAVQPGWYDPTALFGYVNPLSADKYMRPAFLDFLLNASQFPNQAFTVILDEMNLSHPEQYFSPVLSAMESGDRLRLHNEGDSFDGVPDTIPYPANVAFIGTVNMDETTHGLSDKVLDRAFTLEFWDIDLYSYPNWNKYPLANEDLVFIKETLILLLEALQPARMHFGWRTVEDVLNYLGMASQESTFDLVGSFDNVIYARVLPKLRGSESSRLHLVLDNTIEALKTMGLPKSYKKVESLKMDLSESGVMRFWH